MYIQQGIRFVNLKYYLIFIFFLFCSIKAYDTNAIEKGIIFEIPITVVQPEVQFNETSNIFFSGSPIICKPNTIIRRFLLVPNNSTCASKLITFYIFLSLFI